MLTVGRVPLLAMARTSFESARLRGRRWIPQDLQALEAVYGDRAAMRWVGDACWPRRA
jgi:hypothetical protein